MNREEIALKVKIIENNEGVYAFEIEIHSPEINIENNELRIDL